MNVIGIGNYGLINSNYAKKTSTDEVQVSTSFADIVQNKFNTAEETMRVGKSQTKVYADKPLWHWHDGPFGYSAEVYKNEGAASEYLVKLKYDNGKEEVRSQGSTSCTSVQQEIICCSNRIKMVQKPRKIKVFRGFTVSKRADMV